MDIGVSAAPNFDSAVSAPQLYLPTLTESVSKADSCLVGVRLKLKRCRHDVSRAVEEIQSVLVNRTIASMLPNAYAHPWIPPRLSDAKCKFIPLMQYLRSTFHSRHRGDLRAPMAALGTPKPLGRGHYEWVAIEHLSEL